MAKSMKIGFIGSGMVAQTLGAKLLELGNEVMISSRDLSVVKDKGNMGKLPSANQWVAAQEKKGHKAHAGSFADAAAFGEVIFNCTTGIHSLEALNAAGEKNLRGKILVDIANPLDFSKGMPPMIAFCNSESLGERIQAAFPNTKVVKTLNTVNANIQVNPSLVKGEHSVFLAGNDDEAKKWVNDILLTKWFGWKDVIDLGDLSASRGMEMYLGLWARMWGKFSTPYVNIKVVR